MEKAMKISHHVFYSFFKNIRNILVMEMCIYNPLIPRSRTTSKTVTSDELKITFLLKY